LWAVIGLGNPGRRYAKTRHNVGFFFVQGLARRWDVKLKKRKFGARIAEVERDEDTLVLAQPQTYMNQSGVAVMAILKGYRIGPENIVVVYDDIDIPLGQIRVRKEGSAGTHKGMRSVIEEIGTRAFARIRVGIGPVSEEEDATRFVLTPFAEEESRIFKKSLAKAGEAVDMIIAGRIDQAMNEFNQKEKGPAGREEGTA
jgi:peptidyl-tRNA hydrolase, PTH1 family